MLRLRAWRLVEREPYNYMTGMDVVRGVTIQVEVEVC